MSVEISAQTGTFSIDIQSFAELRTEVRLRLENLDRAIARLEPLLIEIASLRGDLATLKRDIEASHNKHREIEDRMQSMEWKFYRLMGVLFGAWVAAQFFMEKFL